MNFYEENLKLFKRKIPMLYETVVNEKTIFDIDLEPVNDSINYLAMKDEKKCFIHSIFDTNEEMDQMFKKVDRNVETLMIFGLGCGYPLCYIRDNFKNIKNILIIEPSLEIFKKFMENLKINDAIKEFKNITFLVNKDINTVNYIVFNYVKDKMGTIINAAYNISYRTLFDNYYENISKTASDFINKTKINMVTHNYFKEQWTYNPIKNMSQEALLITNLFDKFVGKSAIIVSAGPSLNKNIHLLKDIKDKALIAAVGTASKILESNNIKPHFRFAMDSGETEKLIFKDLSEDDSILVYSDRVQHEVPSKFKRRLKMILDLDHLTQYIYVRSQIEYETLLSGFSVANTALDTLIKLGFKNIIFLGQDLCYTKDKLYAEGSWLEDDKINLNDEGYIRMKDIYGEDVYTNQAFLGMKLIFEEIIALNPNVKYINATEGGIGIIGSEIKTLEEVIDETLIETYDYENFFNNLFGENKENKDIIKLFNTIMELEDEINKMTRINNLRIEKLKKINRQLENGVNIKKIERETIELNKYEEDLRKIDSYNNCVKLILEDTYKVILTKFKYEGEDTKEAILSSKEILECISYELKRYLLYFKDCINEAKKNA